MSSAVRETRLKSVPVEGSDIDSFWFEANFNPYGNPYVGDCVIRAVSAALMMKYEAVCRRLKVSLKVAFGANVEGLNVMDLCEPFYEYLEPLEGKMSGLTVREFLSNCGNGKRLPYGVYVLFPPKHAVCAYALSPSKKFFVDTWDSGDEPVEFAFRVRKQVKDGSRDSLSVSEFKKIQQRFGDPEIQKKFVEMAKKPGVRI